MNSDTSNLYVSPPNSAYMLWTPFDMPKSNGTVWAIALSSEHAKFVNAALSVVYGLIFSWLWGLIAAATLYSAPHGFSRRRLVALVALRNASNPPSALEAFVNFTTESMGCFRPRRHGQPSTWVDSLFGLFFVTVCLGVVVGSITMGIIGPAILQIGNVAPVSSNILYYPRLGAVLSGDSEIHRAFIGDPSLRALGATQVFSETIESKVTVSKDFAFKSPMYGLTYGYKITGAELGLKHSTDLTLLVNGSCRTEYGWLRETNDTENIEIYDLFNDKNNNFTVNLAEPYISFPIRTAFSLPNDADSREQASNGNSSYAVVATMARRRSKLPGTDPWYLTELSDEPGSGYDYRIKARRPALSCWQQDTWSCCGGENITGVFNLQKLTRLGVPQVLRDVLGWTLLRPMITTIGEEAGMSSLASVVSSSRSKQGILDAKLASIEQDMKRLVMASYISTLNTLVDSTRFSASAADVKSSDNQFYEEDGVKLQDGADDFVVLTPDVQTFSLTGLIVAVSVATFLLVAKLLLMLKLALHGNAYAGLPEADEIDPHQEISPFNKDRWARFKAFSAVHLLRNAYEDGNGSPQKDWKCSESLPEPREQKPLQLVKCLRGEYGCAGHLAVAPDLLELAPQTRRPRHAKINSLSTLLGDSDIPLHTTNEPPKTTQSGETATPFNDFSSSDTTPQQDDLHVWSPDMQAGYNPYFPQTQPAAPQQCHNDTAICSAPLLQQPGYYYTRG